MSRQVFINGKFFPKEEAKISVYDHGLLYGDGVFEGIRSYNGRPFKLNEHLDRLWESARTILLNIPIARDEIADAIVRSLKLNQISDGYIRVVVTRGAGALGLDINRTSDPQVIIISDLIQLYPKEVYDNGLEIVTVATIRNHPAALSPRVKSLNYLNNIMAKIEGQQAGCVEALMLNHKGEVAECTADNVFITRRGAVMTPPLDAGGLEGITRGVVLELSRQAGYPTSESTLSRHDVFVADECFITGTAAEIVPVVKVDSRPIGTGKPGPIFRELQKRFRELVAN